MTGGWWRFERRWCGWALGLVVVLGVLLRVHHVFCLADLPTFTHPTMDALYHVQWAHSMVAGSTFVEEAYFRLPLYPFFLSICERLLGPDLEVWRLAQAGLGALTVLGTFALGRRALGEVQGLGGALVMASAWLPVHFDTQLLIPALFLPLLTWALWATLGALRDASSRGGALAGLLWGLATLARPTALIMAPVLALLGLRNGSRRVALVPLLLVWGASLVPVAIRNRVVGGEWVPLATQAGVNLWIGNNPASDGSAAIVPGTRAGWWEGFHDARALANQEAGRSLAPAEVSAHYRGRALAWALDEPLEFLQHLGWKVRLAFANRELGNNLEPSWFALAHDPLLFRGWVPFALLHALAALGAWRLSHRCKGSNTDPSAGWRTPLVVFPWVYLAGVVAFFVCARFRLPIWPALAVLAMEGLAGVALGLRQRRGGPAGVALLLIAGSVAATPGSLFPSESIGRMQLGQAWLSAGEVGKGLEELARATRFERVSSHARLAYADALLRAERWAPARRELQLLDAFSPEGAELEIRLLLGEGALSAAEERATEVLASGEGLVGVRYQRARARSLSGDREGALRDLELVLSRDPRHGAAAYGRARVLEELGRDARDAWSEAVRILELSGGEQEWLAEARGRAERRAGS